MNKEIITFTILFVLLVLLQVLLFNHIALFDVAFPIIFIYFIIRLPISLNLSFLFSLSFFTGFVIDVFSDTLGVNCLACTLLAALKRPVFFAYVAKDDKVKNMIPNSKNLGFIAYAKYLFSMVTIYCLLAFIIEYFNFADVKELVILCSSSITLSFVLMLAIDCLFIPET